MTRKQRRLVLIGSGLGVLAVAVALMLNAFRDSIVFFNSPSDVAEKHVEPGTRIRLGGLVKTGSLVRGNDLNVRFEVTDGKSEIPVSYQGVLPDLFREGQGVVAEGALDGGGVFDADTILAKHDETYMPKEVADALKKSGHWKDDYAQQGGDAGCGRSATMIPELGHYALMLALGLALIQGIMPIVGTRSNDPVLMSMAAPAALAQFAFVAIAFAALATCYVTSDFSVLNVYENSHSQMPLIYRLTSVWGNHEGSMMLWVLDPRVVRRAGRGVRHQSAGGAQGQRAGGAGLDRGRLPAFHSHHVESVPAHSQCAVRRPRSQSDPAGSRPRLPSADALSRLCRLLDRFLVRHRRVDRGPHRRGLGALGAALGARRLDVPDASASPCGSYWAYYELGWGGFWFWDPVENASLMPWLAGTALLHSAVVMEKRGALKVWTILLAILAFSLSLIGTFLVRSGVLTSVHAFAIDPTRGIFILAILVVFIGGALALFAWRAPLLKQGGLFAPISREGALVFNNLFLTTACATVFVGTLYPLALEALTGDKISVGPPFFNSTFGPLFIPLMLVMPFGPLMGWKRGDLVGAAQRLLAAAMLAAVAIAAAFAIEHGGPVLAPFGVGIAVFVMAGAVTDIVERTMVLRVPFGVALRRALGLAALGLGHRVCAFRHRRHAARHRRRDRLGQRAHRRDQARRQPRHRALSADVRRRVQPHRPELSRRRRPLHRPPFERRTDRTHGAEPAHLPGPQHGDHRSRADDARRQPALSFARRSEQGRQRSGAALLQAARAADLARRHGHVLRRRPVAVRPAAAHRRAAAGEGQSAALQPAE